MNRNHLLKTGLFILLAIAFLSIIIVSRTEGGVIIPPGEETYEHLNSAREITAETATSYLFYDIFLSWILNIMSISTAMVVIPGILLIITIILFAELLRKEKVADDHITYALALLVFSPAILLMYVGFSTYAFTITLAMATAYLYSRKSSWYLAIIPFLFLADKITGLLVIILLIILEGVRKRKKPAVAVSMTAIALLLLSGFFPALSFHSLAPFFSIQGNEIFSFFGGVYGYPFILIFLGILGMIVSKQSFAVSRRQSVAFIFLALSLFYDPLRLLSMFILAYYGGIAFKHFTTRDWTVTFLKHLTILLIICILIFSTSTTLKETINASPKPYEVEATRLLATIAEKNPQLADTKVLAHPEYTEHVTFYSGFDTLSDDRLVFNILSSQQYSYVKEQLQENEVSFIIIDRSRKAGNLWQRPDQGLLFVLQNNRLFKKIYQYGDYVVYYYTEWGGEETEENVLTRPAR
ncbi:MAG: hypothetical protein ACLFTH_04660 [Candidatus Woesearchaeota archaeon]